MGFSGVRDIVWGQGGDVREGLTRTEWKSDLIHSREIYGAPVMCWPRCEAWGPAVSASEGPLSSRSACDKNGDLGGGCQPAEQSWLKLV